MIRKYNLDDKHILLELLRLNTPTFFDPCEEQHYMNYLDQHSENYYVVEQANKIIGAGGINYGFDEGKTARISWDIIHPDVQRKGIGTLLTKFRIKEIRNDTRITKIVVRTTQLVHTFYGRFGFELEKVEKDFWAEGLDLYQMKMILPC